jgi:Cu/Ag efflux pump CusA
MLLAGFSVNVLTMFGMVLAIGILVDDAIVVVENVEEHEHHDEDQHHRLDQRVQHLLDRGIDRGRDVVGDGWWSCRSSSPTR